MSWMYRVIGRNNTDTSFWLGTSTVPSKLTEVDQKGLSAYFTASATSGTSYGEYIRVDGAGAGAEVIAGRHKTLLTANSVGNAHGHHATLEMDTTYGNVTGLGTGLRGNVVVPNRSIGAGTYYGVMAEIYPLGTSAALPANSNACLAINCQTGGTAMDLVANAIAFGGTDGDGKMIYTSAPQTLEGSVRILINGVAKYLPYYTTQHA